MARSFLSTVVKISREMERAERVRIREAQRQQRIKEQETRRMNKLEQLSYVASRESETQSENVLITRQIEELDTILSSRLDQDPCVDFKLLFKTADETELDKDPNLRPPKEPVLKNYLPSRPNVFVRWFPGIMSGYRRRVADAKRVFDAAQEAYDRAVQERSKALRLLQKKVQEHNNTVIEFARSYTLGVPEAVTAYFELVLGRSPYPDVFPPARRVAYVPESKQLVVEFELPTFVDAVPVTEKFRYIKKTDEIVEVKRSEKMRHAMYSRAIAQAVLRCLYDIFRGDSQEVVETVVVNAHVSTIDPATGHAIHPCLVSVRVTRDRFLGLDLRYVDPVSCLKELKASISSTPGELIAVRPVLEFDMIDPRFVQEADVLSMLDRRPNLMELSPSEFESLITNLFTQMGLDTKLTQPSRDGGVDCVAFDSRPVLGGKVIIQAKRYKNTVGVSAVRDLFGTLHNEGASKGILVTTSGFGKAAYEFANNKPIELITGSNLLYLLKEHADVDAKIEVPPDWVEPPIS
jgi:restriction system protein